MGVFFEGVDVQMAEKTIQINGNTYEVGALNEVARNMLSNIDVTEKKIAALKQELVLFQVARDSFAKTLLTNLPALSTDKA